MRGRVQAMLVAAVTALLSLFLPPLNYISSAVVGLVTLRKGWSEGLIVIVGAGIATALFAGLTVVSPLRADMVAASVWLPVWLLSLILRYTVSLSITVGSAGLIGALIVVGVYLSLSDPAQMWREVIGRIIALAKQQNEAAVADNLGQIMMNTAPQMTGILIAALVVGLTLSLLLARWWQALLFNPGGFAREFQGLRLGRSIALITVVIMALSKATSGWTAEAAANVVIVMAAIYLIHGMGLIHGIVAAKKMHVGWLITVYAVTFIIPQSTILVAAGAFTDSWIDIRARLTKSQNGGNSGHGP